MPAPVVTPIHEYVVLGAPISRQVVATNSPTSYRLDQPIPGVRLGVTTGILSGNPTSTGNHACHIIAQNAAGLGSAILLVRVSRGEPIVPSQTFSTTVGASVHYQIRLEGPYLALEWLPGPLPNGLSLDTATGVISGIPTTQNDQNGYFGVEYPVRARNANGTGAPNVVRIIIGAAITPGGPPPSTAPVVTSDAVAGTVGTALTYHATISGSGITSITATALPPGLKLASDGTINGTPTQEGATSAILTATNASGTGSGTLTFAIAPGGDGPDPEDDSNPNLVIEVDLPSGAASVVSGDASAYFGDQIIIEAHFKQTRFAGTVTNVSFGVKEQGEVRQFQTLIGNTGSSTDGTIFVFPVTTFANAALLRSLTLFDLEEPSTAVAYQMEFFYTWAGRKRSASIMDFVLKRPQNLDPEQSAIVDPPYVSGDPNAPHVFEKILPSLVEGRAYQLRLSFDPVGHFDSLDYRALLSSTSDRLIITPDDGSHLAGMCGWTLLLQSPLVPPPTGYTSPSIGVTARLWGKSWVDNEVSGGAAVWTGPNLITGPAPTGYPVQSPNGTIFILGAEDTGAPSVLPA